jgi:predicted Rossmann fold flavoprotein
METFDVVVIGAGGAGMMCAREAGKRGRKVAVIDHAGKVGAKILISGGGRCNFTNTGAGPENYVSQNPHFCKSALSRFTPADFIALVKEHGIPYHEKKLGQLFCDRSAKDIVEMLVSECETAETKFFLECKCEKVDWGTPSPARGEGTFKIRTNLGEFVSDSLVIATGGLSIPKVGATDFGYRIAHQFGLKVVYPAPALDGFRLNQEDLKRFGDLTGVSVDALVTCNKAAFPENVLFTHAGLSGPAALQASLYWDTDDPVEINFLPSFEPGNLEEWFLKKKEKGLKSEVKTLLGDLLPQRLAERLCELELPPHANLLQLSGKKISDFSRLLQSFTFIPASTIGYGKAEVTRGGVDTDELSSKTMGCKKVPGLYFIGEVVDVTGQLGGYNFQWAWSSGWAAGQAV